MDRTALSPVLLVMATLGCPPESGPKPLPQGPAPEYETPRSYDPEKNIDGTPPALEGDEPPAQLPPEGDLPPVPAPTGDGGDGGAPPEEAAGGGGAAPDGGH